MVIWCCDSGGGGTATRDTAAQVAVERGLTLRLAGGASAAPPLVDTALTSRGPTNRVPARAS